MQWSKGTFSTNYARIIIYPYPPPKYFDPYLIPYTKSNSKWMIDLNIKLKTINLPEENTGENLRDFQLRQRLLRFNTKRTIHERKKKKV